MGPFLDRITKRTNRIGEDAVSETQDVGGCLDRRQTLTGFVSAATLISTISVAIGAEMVSGKGASAALDLKKAALLLLHYQTDIVSLFPNETMSPIVERMRKITNLLRQRGVAIYFVKIGFSSDYREISNNNKNGQMTKRFKRFTSDAILPSLHEEGDTVLTGHRVSGFKGTALDEQLRANGIETLIMAGLVTSGVVLSTLSEASDLDYRILLIEDGCYDPDKKAHDALVSVPFATRADIVTAGALADLL
ncbi:cysteine hydrolase family protein [Novosphingobium sp. P6W]|uniref:cysteine hydrolase family protein n=1 Tax=Novosphingobium sp. P6W TaxID=1609758 RepID=UPI0006985296|nr:isochorismatase family protein [Novosphingobium sp. P6W]